MRYTVDTEFQEITPPTERQVPKSAPVTPIDLAIFVEYTPVTVEQIGV